MKKMIIIIILFSLISPVKAANVQVFYAKIDALLPCGQQKMTKALINKNNAHQAINEELKNQFLEKKNKALESLKDLLKYVEVLENELNLQKGTLQNDYIALRRNIFSAKNNIKFMIKIVEG